MVSYSTGANFARRIWRPPTLPQQRRRSATSLPAQRTPLSGRPTLDPAPPALRALLRRAEPGPRYPMVRTVKAVGDVGLWRIRSPRRSAGLLRASWESALVGGMGRLRAWLVGIGVTLRLSQRHAASVTRFSSRVSGAFRSTWMPCARNSMVRRSADRPGRPLRAVLVFHAVLAQVSAELLGKLWDPGLG